MSSWQVPSDIANRFHLLTKRKRTGFVGLGQSGKTVLMTAIIDRVRKMNGRLEDRMVAGRLTHRTGRLPPLPPASTAFCYDTFLESLTGEAQTWPRKTTTATRCRYMHYLEGANAAGKAYARNRVEEHLLLDIPGERLADFTLAGRSFEDWSDALLYKIADRPEYYRRAEPFFDLIEAPDAASEEVIRAYKRVLAEFARSAIPLVTPSSFLIHPEGKYPKTEREAAPHKLTHDQLVERGIVGLSAQKQFAPLTQTARQANPHLVEAFRPHFDAYRQSVGEVMVKNFYACDNLVVLVDVASVLEGGPKTYHATRNCIKRLLEVLDPGHKTLSSTLKDIAINIIRGERGGVEKIDKIAFVATKADVIHSSQRRRLMKLLAKVTEDLLPAGSAERYMSRRSFAVAAIQAAEEDEIPPRMKGFIRMNGRTSETPQVLPYPRELPEAWPPESSWKEGDFVFGGFLPPRLDANGNEFWPNIGIEALVKYLGLISI